MTSEMESGEVVEPYVGMEFESEDSARSFYNDYARRLGFVVRIMQRRRSEIDGRTLARRLGCNKQGFSPNNKGTFGPEKKQRPSAREGCKATILFKLEKTGKWVVTRFVKDHNHPLVATAREYTNTLTELLDENSRRGQDLLISEPARVTGMIFETVDQCFLSYIRNSRRHDKDEKIQQLTRELQRQDHLCASYRERLLNFLTSIEEQAEELSLKVQSVVNNVKKVEDEEAWKVDR